MRTRTVAASTLVLLAACAGGPPPPDWQANAQQAAEHAVLAYLEGNPRAEAAQTARMRGEIARSGRADLLARAELMRCAARTASLVFEPCAAFEALRVDAAPPERAYADWLAGSVPAADIALLPEPQRAAASGGAAALRGIEDPLSRLIAAGVLLQAGRADAATLDLAIDTASAQGWRRPLLAWLQALRMRLQAGGDAEGVARVQRRIDLVGTAR
jgi:hypothetical protein